MYTDGLGPKHLAHIIVTRDRNYGKFRRLFVRRDWNYLRSTWLPLDIIVKLMSTLSCITTICFDMIMDASNLSNSGTSAAKGNEEKVKISINHRSFGCWLVVFHCHCAPSAAEEHLRSVKSFMDLRLFYEGGKKMLTEEEGTAVMQDLVVWKMLFFKRLSWVRYTIKYTDIRHVHLYIFFVLGATMGELRPHVAGSIRGHCDVTGLPSFRVQRWLSCLRCWEILYCVRLNRVHALWNENATWDL